MSKTAIILGSSGLTGSYLLELLLNHDEYKNVKIFVRKKLALSHPKLKQIVCDLFKLEDYKDEFFADVVYCCIGTTKAKTPDLAEYKAIDFGIPVNVAKLCEDNNIPTLSVISAINADKNSKFFYARTKGQMEEKVLRYNIKNIYIYRPSLIYGKREDFRLGEKIGFIVFKTIGAFLKPKYRPISGKELANAMVLGAKTKNGKKILHLFEK